MTFDSIAEIEAWRYEIGVAYRPLVSVGFDPTALGIVAGGDLGDVPVASWRAALGALVEAIDGFTAGSQADALVSAALATFPIFGLGNGAVGRLEDATRGNAVQLRAEASALLDLIDGARPGASVRDAFAAAFSEPVEGTDGPDVDRGGPGADEVDLRGGNDIYDGAGGDDVVLGGRGADLLFGGAGEDTVVGGAGPDRLWGGAGDDAMFGDAMGGGAGGADWMRGGRGDDDMAGGGGRDRMWGGAGRDEMNGGAGNDTLRGNQGDDVLEGGAGRDVMVGGLGRDVFVFDGRGRDVVRDFRDDVDALLLDVGGDVADGRAWLEANAELRGRDVVISIGEGELVVKGLGQVAKLFDDVDFLI